MDALHRPKTEFSLLERLIPDLWASVTHYLVGEHLARLKLTGSKLLWSRLCAPNVVKSISLGKDFINFTKRLKLLKELPSAIEFELECFSKQKWDDWQPRVKLLPSTLRSLKLNFLEDFFEDFFEANNSSGSTWGSHMPFLESLDVQEDWDQIDWLISNAPTNLTILRVATLEGTPTLPPSLVHLYVDYFNIEDLDHFKFPQTLETFNSRFVCSDLRRIVPQLPQLRTLDVYDYEYTMPAEPITASLPKTITHLGDLRFLLTEAFCEVAPTLQSFYCLTHLKLHGLRPEFWTWLPQSLTSLELHDTPNPTTKKVSSNSSSRDWPCSFPIHCIPKSVTQLSICLARRADALWKFSDHASLVSAHSGQIQVFPPNLRRFELIDAQLDPVLASFLPTSLVFLIISHLDEHICERLPKGLVSLRSSSTDMSSYLIKYLPKSLRYLDLTFKTPYAAMQNGMEKNLDVNRFSVDWRSNDCQLPPNLLQLSLRGCLDDSLAKQSLKSLQALSLTGCDLTDEVIPFLSRHLTTLSIDSPKMTGKCFHALPETLTSLSLTNAREIEDSDIQHLPQSLTTVHLPCAVLLTECCIKDLPKKLEKLTLSENRNFNPKVISRLPSLLKSGQGRGSFSVKNWYIWYGSLKFHM